MHEFCLYVCISAREGSFPNYTWESFANELLIAMRKLTSVELYICGRVSPRFSSKDKF